MIRIEWFCKRCGKKIDEKQYNLISDCDALYGDAIMDNFCEDCMVKYEALKCRQAEERELFWEGEDE